MISQTEKGVNQSQTGNGIFTVELTDRNNKVDEVQNVDENMINFEEELLKDSKESNQDRKDMREEKNIKNIEEKSKNNIKQGKNKKIDETSEIFDKDDVTALEKIKNISRFPGFPVDKDILENASEILQNLKEEEIKDPLENKEGFEDEVLENDLNSSFINSQD